MKSKPETFRIWPLAIVVMLLLPAGHVETAAAIGNTQAPAMIADPMSILAMRSSGRRGAGALAQSKMAYAPTETPPGDFLGLSPELALPSDGGGFAPEPPLAPEPVSDMQPTRNEMSSMSPPGFDDSPGFGYFEGGFGSNFGDYIAIGGAGFAPGVPRASSASGLTPAALPLLVQPPVPSPVPEPGAWLMMVAGFVAVGSALRSRHRSESAARADAIGPLPTCKR